MSAWIRLHGPRNVELRMAYPDEEQALQEGRDMIGSRSDAEPESQSRKEGEEYFPSVSDVLCVQAFLSHLKIGNGTRQRDEGQSQVGGDQGDHVDEGQADRLPVEIVDMILDGADYWASIETKMDGPRVIRQDQDAEVLKTGGLCYSPTAHPIDPRILPYRTAHPCRKISFTVTSHDQGWGGSQPGSYDGSWTWFDAYTIPAFHPTTTVATTTNTDDSDDSKQQQQQQHHYEPAELVAQYQKYYHEQHQPRFTTEANFLPSEHKLCCNKVATGDPHTHRVVWHYLDDVEPESAEASEVELAQGRGRATLNGRMVREMGVGDEVCVWARARFPGWVNYVDELSVRVFWAV
ncbi:hypothetical protein PRK78_007371 [Emydomyces testavorans]|uniref:Uncharacterized protein n=1 Tax=Emydomyces testavorans TaxID=2070801 RepID=A0AAF0IQI5_9EURO|nr:hypothetical protein PRK78_007371 [Emydomyces testavorans]